MRNNIVNISFALCLICCLYVAVILAEESSIISPQLQISSNPVHVRAKRTLLLKKKLLGAGLLGFGLGAGIGAFKGYKYGHYSRPYNYYSPTIYEYPAYYSKPYYYDRPRYYSYSNYGNYY